MKLFSSSPRFEIGSFPSQSITERVRMSRPCLKQFSLSRTRLRIRVRFLSFPDPDLLLEKGSGTIVINCGSTRVDLDG